MRRLFAMSLLGFSVACPQPGSAPTEEELDPPGTEREPWRASWQVPAPGATELPACDGWHPAATAIERVEAASPDAAFGRSTLQDSFRMEWLDGLRSDPLVSRCLGRALPAGLEPSEWIRAGARLLGDPADRATVPNRPAALDPILAALEEISDGEVAVRVRETDPELEAALAPILWAALDALAVRDEVAAPVRGGDWWAEHGGNGLLPDPDGEGYNAAHPSDRAVLEARRGRTYAAAAQIAEAVASVRWTTAGRAGTRLDVETPRGRLLVRGTGDDDWEATGPLWVSIDLGGRDRYAAAVGANADGVRSVSVHVDVAGDDVYAYPEALDRLQSDLPLPDDGAGRFDRDPDCAGASASDVGRQGSGRFGVGLLFDLDGDDAYRSLRASQGYAHHGVGLLYDGGGDDVYLVEEAGQGAAQYGLGLLIDGAGHDRRIAFSRAQGHGFVGGVGLSVDGEGDDAYVCRRAPVVHPAPQDPEASNASLCQGAGLGWRHDDPDLAMSGGLGWLVDWSGDDRYEGAVFAQGVGYWQGIGVLWDDAGDDRYDAVHYAQGSGVHFGVGLQIDGGGRDRHGETTPALLSSGSGHDYGLGVQYDAWGDDTLDVGPWSGGAGSCGGRGIRVDDGGADTYRGPAAAYGAATSESCPGWRTIGLFWDATGVDRYLVGGSEAPRDRTDWGESWGLGAEARGCDEGGIVAP